MDKEDANEKERASTIEFGGKDIKEFKVDQLFLEVDDRGNENLDVNLETIQKALKIYKKPLKLMECYEKFQTTKKNEHYSRAGTAILSQTEGSPTNKSFTTKKTHKKIVAEEALREALKKTTIAYHHPDYVAAKLE